jgi:anti-sigma B factor antagonist
VTGLDVAPRHRRSELTASSTVVRLCGDLGIAAAPALRERLTSALRPGTRLLVLDLSRVQSCDPAGLAVLIGTQRRAGPHDIVICLVAPSLPVMEQLRATGLERCLTVCPDLPSALAWGGCAPVEAAAPAGKPVSRLATPRPTRHRTAPRGATSTVTTPRP